MNESGLMLCVRLKKYPDFWCLPGGTLDAGEDYVTAVKRECIEELGIAPELGNPVYVQQIFENSEMILDEIGFAVKNYSEFEDFDLTKTSHGAIEIEEAAFIDITKVHFLPANLKTLLPDSYSKLLTMPCQVFSNTIEHDR